FCGRKHTSGSKQWGGVNLRLVNAAITIQSFKNVEVYHIPGKINIVPDALSRLPSTAQEDGIPSTDEPVAKVQAGEINPLLAPCLKPMRRTQDRFPWNLNSQITAPPMAAVPAIL
ncbi:hypothetical protein KEM55_001335, partial [Ascosphaera atra]